jgi:hypothetical protein
MKWHILCLISIVLVNISPYLFTGCSPYCNRC